MNKRMQDLINTRNELRSALNRIQGMIDVQVRADADAARAKRKARKDSVKKEPCVPARDPRVDAIRAVMRIYSDAPIYNSKRADGSRRIKLWAPLAPGTLEGLRCAISIAIEGVTEASYHTVAYGVYGRKTESRCLCVVIPAQK